jgi:hypothetical protein
MRNINSILIITGFIAIIAIAIFVIVGCENGDPGACTCTCDETAEIVSGEVVEEVTEVEVTDGVTETTETTETDATEEAAATEKSDATEEADDAEETDDTEEEDTE